MYLAQQISIPQIEYPAILPVLIVLGAACVSVLVEAFLPKSQRWGAQVLLSLTAIVLAGVSLVLYVSGSPKAGLTTLAGAVSVDKPALFLWGTLLALALGAVLLIADRTVERGGAFAAQASIRP